MFDALLYIIIIMGPIVLMTYVEAYHSPNRAHLWGGLPQTTWYKNPWVISMMLTVVSFLYMSGMWVFVLEDVQQNELVFSYILFMTGAILWAPLTLVALQREQKLGSVAAALWLTAAGSVGFLINVCTLKNQPLMVLAAVICMLHHVGFDAIYWWYTWHPRDTATPFFTSEQTETKTKYDTLNFF
jgi:hypothetical protein